MLSHNPNELPAVLVDRFQSSVENGQAMIAFGHAVSGADPGVFVFHTKVSMSLANLKTLGLLALETCLKAAGVTVKIEDPAPPAPGPAAGSISGALEEAPPHANGADKAGNQSDGAVHSTDGG